MGRDFLSKQNRGNFGEFLGIIGCIVDINRIILTQTVNFLQNKFGPSGNRLTRIDNFNVCANQFLNIPFKIWEMSTTQNNDIGAKIFDFFGVDIQKLAV